MTVIEELATAIGGSGPPPVGFRQGTVITFDANTGSNVIDVGDAQLLNLPMLNSGEAVALKPGHIVGLLTWHSSWWILGRITPAGSPQFASASVAFDGARDVQFGISLGPGAPGPAKASAVLNVPPWADEAIVMATADGTGDNTSAQDDDAFYIHAKVGGVNGHENMASVHIGRQHSASASMERLIVNPGSTITVVCGMRTNIATWPAGNSRAGINAIAVYRSTS